MWWSVIACASARCGPDGVQATIEAPDPPAAAAALRARLDAWGLACTEVVPGDGVVEVWLPSVRSEAVAELLKPNQLALWPTAPGGEPFVQAGDPPRTWTVDRAQDLRPRVVSATTSQDGTGQTTTVVTLDAPSAERLAAWTRDHVGEVLVVAIDGAVLVAPIVREPLTAGRLQLNGPDVPDDLAAALRTPPVPPGLKLRSLVVVGPSGAP